MIDDTCTRKRWMLALCERLEAFYPKELRKVRKRQDDFKEVRTLWESRADE